MIPRGIARRFVFERAGEVHTIECGLQGNKVESFWMQGE
jgi:hypothetical protein